MKFNEALTISDHNFENILKIMKLKRESYVIDSLRNLLCTINLIIEHYLNKEDDQLKIIVSYFPICNEYAQEICEEFVCLKFGLYANEDWQSTVANKLNHSVFYVPTDVKTKKQRELAHENYKFEKEVAKILKYTDKEYYGYGETLIYSDYLTKQFSDYKEAQRSYNRKYVNKYWYLSHTISDFRESASYASPLQIIYKDADELYNSLISRGQSKIVENMVVFPMKAPDGRYSDFCSDFFQKPYLDDFVNSSLGLRNVFFFTFSRKPYKLRRLIDFKQRMKDCVQITDEDSYDFISFTYEEAQILSGNHYATPVTINVGKGEDELQKDYESLLDDITSGLDYDVLRRNEMSLCLTLKSSELYSQKLLEETEADDVILNEILTLNHSLWERDAEVSVYHFVFGKRVFIILGNNISLELQKHLRNKLMSQCGALSVDFGTFSDLKGYNESGTYYNQIRHNRIIVMSYRNDCTDSSIFHKYPNSFDPFCINNGQRFLVINNYFYLRNHLEWGQYNYMKALKKILKSEFRASVMKPQIREFKKPSKKQPSDYREEELDRIASSRTAPQMQVIFADNSVQSYLRSELVLYKSDTSTGVTTLSDLSDIYESCKKLEIQSLSPLVKQVYKTFIDLERDKDSRSERMFKEQESYGLSREEIDSDAQLWKILLARKIVQHSYEEVYDEIMSHFDERYKISFHSFMRWLEPDYGIPRARKMQKYLVENYLGIRPPYINLIRRIKERTKSDTEAITHKIRHFLSIALLANDYDKVLNAISDDIKDLLDISTTNDIKNIMSNITCKIQFETVKTIIQ